MTTKGAMSPLVPAIVFSLLIGGVGGYCVRYYTPASAQAAPASGGMGGMGGGGGMGGRRPDPERPFASDRNKKALDDLIGALEGPAKK